MNRTTLALTAAAFTVASPLAAQQRSPEPAERVHVVRAGDTLWDLARSYLNDPFLWPEIFRLNPDQIRDPARIYPSERLRIPGFGEVAEMEVGGERRTVFFPRDQAAESARGPAIRAAGTADVPVLTPGDFSRAGFLAQESEVSRLGRVAEVLSPSVVPVRLDPLISVYDRVYVTLDRPAGVQVGGRLHLIRPGERVKPYGREFRTTGEASVVAVDGVTATVVIDQVYDAITTGDLVIAAPAFPITPGVAPQPAAGLAGEIIAFAGERPLYSVQDLGYANVGEQAGVDEGDEFVAYLPPETRRGQSRPEVEVARLQVVRVTDRTATFRVMDVKYPALAAGLPIRRIAKMP